MRKLLLTLMCAFLLVAGASSVYAQPASQPGLNCSGPNGECTYTPLEPLPTGQSDAQTGRNFPAFVSGMFRVLITLGGLFSVVMFTVAGIGYMISESAIDVDKAKKRARAAFWGLLLLAASWLILNTINPDLVTFRLLVGSTPNSAPTTNIAGTGTGGQLTDEMRRNCEDSGARIVNTPTGQICQYPNVRY